MKIAKRASSSGRAGRRMGLPVGDHLQPVLDAAEETVGARELARRAPVQMAGAGQQAQRGQRARLAQPGIAPAPDQLQRLRQELDLADAAAAELHVVPGDAPHRIGRHRAAAPLLRVDAALHRVDVGDGGEIEMPAPDEGADRREEVVAERDVAGDRARLDHRRAFPVLPHALVIGERRGQRDRGRRRGRVGAQPQIGAEDIAIRVACFHDRNQVARQA